MGRIQPIHGSESYNAIRNTRVIVRHLLLTQSFYRKCVDEIEEKQRLWSDCIFVQSD